MKVLLICNYKPGAGGISGQVEILQRHLRDEGHTAAIFSTKGSSLWRLGLLRRLRNATHEYDAMHIHCCSGWGFLPAVVGVTVGRWLRKRVVLTYHGGGGEHFFDRHPRLVRRFLLRTDTNIVLSGFLAHTFDRHNIPYVTIPNILDLDDSRFRLRNTLHPNFICTRAHEPLYNIPCILKAFRQVQTEVPEATLTLVGNGNEHQRLIQLSHDLGLHNVTFTGRVDNDEIYTYLDRADILLSAPTVDNMPVSLLEAMNAGLLIISSNVGGVPFMVKDNTTGLLFESDNDKSLAQKMLWALHNQPLAMNIIMQAHTDVAQYRWENVKDKLYDAYGIPS